MDKEPRTEKSSRYHAESTLSSLPCFYKGSGSMKNIAAIAKQMAMQVSQMVKESERYEEYQKARKAIYADEDLYKKIKDFLVKHMSFLYSVKNGTATFEEERYLSQEFHKLMLDKNVNTYFEMGLYYVETLAEIYITSVNQLDIDLDFVEV